MKVTIFDYGAGNLHSLAKAIEEPGVSVRLETDVDRAIDTDVLVLPGVGAFGLAAQRLESGRERIRSALEQGLPCLGICLGMQLLFNGSAEGAGDGIGLIPGRVERIHAKRIPHIGWNGIEASADPLFEQAPLEIAYYANSFVCRPDDEGTVIAWSRHEDDRFPAAVRSARTVGVQFHPEKSSEAGVRFIRAFVRDAGR